MIDWARLDAPLTLTILHVRRGQWWPALASMGRTPRELATVPGLRWFRYMGCGRGAGFSRWPDWYRYALLGAWQDAAAAQAFWRQCPLGDDWPFGYHAKTLTFWLAPGSAKGSWRGEDPIAGYPPAHIGSHGPVAVLTRARVRLRGLPGFWRTAGPATTAVESAPGLRYSLGAGTNPVTELCTFSVWDSAAAMQQYAYRTPEHRAAMVQAQQQGWFAESFFARMAVRAVTGTHPLARTLQEQLFPAAESTWRIAA